MIEKIKQDINLRVEAHDLPAHLDVGVGSVINAMLFGYRWNEVGLLLCRETY